MTAIVARALRKRFAALEVLRGLELTVPQGSIYGLVGANGAGKTTLLKLAMGLLRPSAGEVRVLGDDLATAGKERVGYVAEESLLPGWMSLAALLRFEQAARPRLDRARVEAHLARRRLERKRSVRSLSKGQRKRLELELALASGAPVLILDEPLDGLDPVARAEAMEALVGHVADLGATVLISSHILPELERLCDRVGVLAGGRIAFEAELDDLKRDVALVHGEGELPLEVGVVARRTGVALARGLAPASEESLGARGFQVRHPSLDELGVELMRCLEQEESLR